MQHQLDSAVALPLRPPSLVMDPTRLGAMHQTRISFVRSILRKMTAERWRLSRPRWDLDEQGLGTAIYRLDTPHHFYHLVVFATALKDEERNDRVIAEKWDVTFALVFGEVDDATLTQLQANVPLQEAGRNNPRVMVLSRANKSVRVFEHLVNSLAQGRQPARDELAQVGYILRTTAVYGNGKFGIADFELLQDNPDFHRSFSAQMCAVYLLRQFSLDWIHYLAKQRGGARAATLSRPLQRYLGIGNATGLGMAPYLLNHPQLVDQWLTQRESALARVRAQTATDKTAALVCRLLDRAHRHLTQVVTIDEHQAGLNQQAIAELPRLSALVGQASGRLWDQVLEEAQVRFGLESQEILTTCIMEPYPELVDEFEEQMNVTEELTLAPGLTVADFRAELARAYDWALAIDFRQPENQYWFWYRSAEKEEPRMGVRGQEPGDDKEVRLDIARQVSRLDAALARDVQQATMAAFLLQHPQFRAITRRAWTMSQCRMGEIRMNVLGRECLPMQLLRCKLSMFGATKFDPRSSRWVRVTLFQGAPLMDEVHDREWLFPLLPNEDDE
ncbi:hypothetical protein [Zobellella maritima]|uniref:hypothetical protein n=1 Tax=Zobellella maritima TaxID=2059725 RepID=UPI000E305D87|nr:hypothetical protein [Zobellella maritima]